MAKIIFSEVWEAIGFIAPLKRSIKKIISDPDTYRKALVEMSYDEFNNMQETKLSKDQFEILIKLLNELTDINQAEHCLKCIDIYETYSGRVA